MTKEIEIHVSLLEEGSAAYRKTTALELGNSQYKLLADSDYDPEDEVWEFLPGSVVRGMEKINFGEKILVAVEKVS